MRIALLGGAYQARSLIANAQRCVNLYPERNPGDSPVPVTHYLTPGLLTLTTGLAGACRGLYTASSGQLFGVFGDTLYSFSTDGTFSATARGTVANLTTPVSMSDNGSTLVMVDGTTSGWTVDLGTLAFAAITDVNFLGGSKADYLDTFLVFSQPGTRNLYSSLSNTVAFDPTYVAAKTGGADKLQALVVLNRNIWLLGALTTEVWINSGGAQFPFEELPGTFKDHGCLAPFSVAKADTSFFFLGQDRQGSGIVFEANEGYQLTRVSTHAIENIIAELGDIDTAADAIGSTYQQGGHVFYVLTFSGGNRTLVYDKATQLWHERAWMNPVGGALNRVKYNFIASAQQSVVAGDRSTGKLYLLSLDVYTDAGDPIQRLRTFPHVEQNGDRIIHTSFTADMAPANADVSVNLSWSDDRGANFGAVLSQTFGSDSYSSVQWSRLGMARDRVYQLDWTAAVETALQGAWLETIKART